MSLTNPGYLLQVPRAEKVLTAHTWIKSMCLTADFPSIHPRQECVAEQRGEIEKCGLIKA